MKKWLKAAGVRAVKTVAQTAIATIGTAAVISAVDWKMVISASLLAGGLSLLTSVAGLSTIILALFSPIGVAFCGVVVKMLF